MIVRDEDSSLLLITQPDHARLAHDIVAAMRSEAVLHGPGRDTILLATREHDNGWLEIDADPTVDPETGRPYDFITAPTRVKHDLWPHGIARVAKMNPRAGALVAQHAITVYNYRAREPEWHPFFGPITAMRDDLLRQLGVIDDGGRDAFARDYRCVRLGDFFSLQFCNGWTDAQDTEGYRVELRGSTLIIAPDPFDGGSVPLRVMARRIPARRYVNDADLNAALADAVPEFLIGEARGAVTAM
jgi:Protein of unknown function (DUF3891)